ncbi:Os06g0674600 [Oryza sativa Japonica Group]|jgi:hypothetical protein|uniref:Uncharacterized protein n=3 Tax=Oryza TaxID=4527 RepID=A0A8J8XYM9_ORYSJ|nr:hypothetical protein OsJ_22343 [Oryza sativa Japonica Group]KAF2928062.1 hypothetical protein DAI22_06g251000 [Oryza sativa Japonica Group]BAS99098.1 Os06g0674600 [Oryza sativa Japonica Group]
MANHLPREHEQRGEAAVIAIDDGDDGGVQDDDAAVRLALLDAGRALMLCGALASVGSISHNHHGAFVGHLLWLLGVSLLALVPAPPAAARFAAAVLAYFLSPPWW